MNALPRDLHYAEEDVDMRLSPDKLSQPNEDWQQEQRQGVTGTERQHHSSPARTLTLSRLRRPRTNEAVIHRGTETPSDGPASFRSSTRVMPRGLMLL